VVAGFFGLTAYRIVAKACSHIADSCDEFAQELASSSEARLGMAHRELPKLLVFAARRKRESPLPRAPPPGDAASVIRNAKNFRGGWTDLQSAVCRFARLLKSLEELEERLCTGVIDREIPSWVV